MRTTVATMSGPDQEFVLEEVELEDPRDDEILVRVVATGLCHTDLTVRTMLPPEMFPFVFGMERLEFTMHSVHYMDLVRSFLGNPTGVSATTVGHPLKELASTRSTVILRYADRPLRVVITTNHDHDYGGRFEESYHALEADCGWDTAS